MKLSLVKGTTSKIVHIFIQDSSVTTGAGLTGLVFNTSSLVAYYIRPGDAAATAITLATATVGTWATGGFKEVSSANMPGLYEFHIPNACLATGANQVVIMLKGAANMVPCLLEIELTAVDNQSATGFVSSVPSVVGNVGGNVTGSVGSVVGGVGGNVNGSVNSVAANGITEASFNSAAGSFNPLGIIDQGTAQGATATTLQLRAAAAFADNEINGAWATITGGTTGVGQTRRIRSHVGSTDTATVDAWATTPTGTITYKIRSAPPKLDTNVLSINDVSTGGVTTIGDHIGTTGASTAQTGDSFAIVNNGTYGNSALNTAIGTRMPTSLYTAPPSASTILTTFLGTTNGAATLATQWANADVATSSRLASASYAAPPTVAQIATGVWQDTVAGDFTVVGSIGIGLTNSYGLVATNLNAAITSRLAAASYSAPPSVAAIATGIWQDATAGDFTAANSIGKALYVTAIPGAANGHFIAGVNAGTTVNITGNLSGSVGSIAVNGIGATSFSAAALDKLVAINPTLLFSMPITNVVSQTTFESAAVAGNSVYSALAGQLVLIHHAGNIINTPSIRRVVSVTQDVTDVVTVVIDSPPAFTIAVGDTMRVLATPSQLEAIRTKLPSRGYIVGTDTATGALTEADVWAAAARTLTAGTNIVLPNAQTFSTSGSVGSVAGLNPAYLDVAVSSRLASGSYGSPPSATTIADAVAAQAAIAAMMTTVSTNLDARISGILTGVTVTVDDASLAAFGSAVRTELTVELGRIDVSMSSRFPTSGYTAPDNASAAAAAASASSANSKLGTPAGLSVSADILVVSTNVSAAAASAAAADTKAGQIKLKTDNLPTSPAAVGSAMTLTSAYDAAKTAAQAGNAMTLTPGERTAIQAAFIDESDGQAVLAAMLAKINTLVGTDVAPLAIAAAVRANMTVELARIDAAVSTRVQGTPGNILTVTSDGKVHTDSVLGQIDLDAIIQAIESSVSFGPPADLATQPISATHTFVLVHTKDGLRSEHALRINRSSLPAAFAVDFRNDLTLNQKIYSALSRTVVEGSTGGITLSAAASWLRNGGSQLHFMLTPATVGVYRVRIVPAYTNPGGGNPGDILIEVVA